MKGSQPGSPVLSQAAEAPWWSARVERQTGCCGIDPQLWFMPFHSPGACCPLLTVRWRQAGLLASEDLVWALQTFAHL